MRETCIAISKKPKGEDGYKTFSIRIKEETVAELDEIAQVTNRSRNEIINQLLDYSVKHCEIVE